MGDFGNATEAIRIVDRFAFLGFTKNSDRGNFRLLQQYRSNSEVRTRKWEVKRPATKAGLFSALSLFSRDVL
jgi:hypothetical protein